MQIIGIGNKKIHIGPSLQKIYILVPPQVILFFFTLESAASWGHKQGNTLDALIVHCIATNCQVVKTKKISAILWAGLHYQQGTFSLQTMPWCCSVAECWEVPLHHDTQWNTILPLRCSSSIWAWHTNQSPHLQYHPRPPSSRTVMRISTCHQLCYADYWKDLQSHTWTLIGLYDV